MKTMFRAITITVTLACGSAIKTLAQDEPPAPPQPPPPVAIIHGVQNLAEGTVHMVQNDVEKHVHDAQQMVSKFLQPHIVKLRRGGPRTVKSLVIRSSEMAPRAQSELEEDMTIMAHILDKALAEQFADDPAGRVAMGINVSFVPGEGPTRNLYLDGYGAVFFLNVNFPLLPPPQQKDVEKERAPANSTWEEARAEVYGQSGPNSSISRPEYDAAKVAALKKALLDSLKNAANIRSVRSDESITVCVVGAPARGPVRVTTSSGDGGFGHSVGSGGGGGGGGFGPFSGSGGGGGGGGGEQSVWVATSGNDDASGNKTTLTIRVKKADCEAFADGKLTADEFRNRATITIYGEPQS